MARNKKIRENFLQPHPFCESCSWLALILPNAEHISGLKTQFQSKYRLAVLTTLPICHQSVIDNTDSIQGNDDTDKKIVKIKRSYDCARTLFNFLVTASKFCKGGRRRRFGSVEYT